MLLVVVVAHLRRGLDVQQVVPVLCIFFVAGHQGAALQQTQAVITLSDGLLKGRCNYHGGAFGQSKLWDDGAFEHYNWWTFFVVTFGEREIWCVGGLEGEFVGFLLHQTGHGEIGRV